MATWARTTFPVNAWAKGYALLATVPQNQTLLRTRFGWGASAVLDARESMIAFQRVSVGFGIITAPSTVATSALPDPSATGVDPAPPLQRFIWWEQRQMTCRAIDEANGVHAWSTSAAQEIADSKSQVIAATSGTATLKVYAVWGSQTAWTFTGEGNIWAWASVLYE